MTVTLTEEMVRSLTWMAKRLPLAGRKLRGTFLYECKRHRRMGHTKVGGARPTTRGGGEKWIFGDWIGGWPAWKEGGDWLAAFAWSLKSVPACCAYRRPVNSILERSRPHQRLFFFVNAHNSYSLFNGRHVASSGGQC